MDKTTDSCTYRDVQKVCDKVYDNTSGHQQGPGTNDYSCFSRVGTSLVKETLFNRCLERPTETGTRDRLMFLKF